MKFSIARESLSTPLQAIAGVVEKKQTMPVLSNILIQVADDSVTLTGTNMEVELVCRIEDVTVSQTGQITVPAKKLSEIVRSLSEDFAVELWTEGDRLTLKSGNSTFTLATLPAEHFPNVEEEASEYVVRVEQSDLKNMISSAAFAMAQQDVRYYLNGMLLESDQDVIRLVATDGHRLAMASNKIPTGVTEHKQVIIPRKGVLELARLLGEDGFVELVISDSHIRSRIGAYTFTSKLIEGKFPDYNRVIPRGGDKTILADPALLKSALLRAGILSHENIRGIRLHLSTNLLKVTANNPEHEQAEDYVEVDYQGDELQIGFNVGYLIDVMNNIDDERIKIILSNPNSSALIEPVNKADVLYVIMPMRL